MKTALLLITALTFSLGLVAQAQPAVQWTWEYGDDGFERALAVRATPDGGAIIAGDYTEVLNGQTDMLVVKLSPAGTPDWIRAYGSQQWAETAFDILPMRDGGYTVVGFTGQGSAGTMDDLGNSYIVRINSAGDTLWTRMYGFGGIDDIYGAVEMANGDIVVAGTSESGLATPPDGDVFFIRFTASGDSLWTRFIRRPNSDWVEDFIQTSDGGFAVTGIHNTPPGSTEMQGFFYQKFDADLSEEAYRVYNWQWAGHAYGISEAPGQGFYLCGQGFDDDGMQQPRVTLVNVGGDTLWTRMFDISPAMDFCLGASVDADGGLLLACSNYFYGESHRENFNVTKISPEGELVWTAPGTATGRLDMAQTVCQTSDGGYIIAGVTFQPLDSAYEVGNVYAVKFAQPDPVTPPLTSAPAQWSLMQNYPNPFNPTTEIGYTLTHAQTVRIAVYDPLGRQIATLANGPQAAGEHRVRFDGSSLPGGTYFYRLETGNNSQTRKMILIK